MLNRTLLSSARSLGLACALAVLLPAAAGAQSDPAKDNVPALRSNVTVSSDVVRIGDLIDNAGENSQIALYRSPDLGTTGSLPVSDILSRLGSHHLFAVDTRGLKEIRVTREARVFASGEIEQLVARALERKNGLGSAADIAVSFDREVQTLRIDPARVAEFRPTSVRFDPRSGRFDISFEVPSSSASQARLRVSGVATESMQVAVLTRQVERGEILRQGDVTTERRPKAEAGQDAVGENPLVGMQMKKQMRAGQVLHTSDIAKPDLVLRDQTVTIVYRMDGLQLTMRAKALENGGMGDTVSVINIQSKRTLQAVVTAPGQVMITPPAPITTASLPVAPRAQKAE